MTFANVPNAYLDDPSDILAFAFDAITILLVNTTDADDETRPGTTLLTDPTMSDSPVCTVTNTKLSTGEVEDTTDLSNVPPTP